MCVDLQYYKVLTSTLSTTIRKQGRIQGDLWGLGTPPPEIYQGSQKNDVLV